MTATARCLPVPRFVAILEAITGIDVASARLNAAHRPIIYRMRLDPPGGGDDGNALLRSLPLAFALSSVLWTVLGGVGVAVATIVA